MADYQSDAARRRRAGLLGAMETDPAAPGLTAMEAALMAAGGPIGRTVAAAPRAAGAAFGLLSGMGGLNEAEAQAKRGASASVTQADRDAASVLPEPLRPQYIDLVSRSRAGILPRADREILGQLQGIIAKAATGKDDAERGRLAEAGTRAEEARQRVMRDAPKSFQERFGDAASYTPIAPLIAAMTTMAPIAVVGGRAAARTAGEWRAAANKGLNATDAPTLANSASLANAYEKQFPKPTVGNSLSPYAIPAAIGGIEGAGIANIPDEWNASLPPENPERKAYEAYLKELPANHPDYERAKRIYDSLPQTNPTRDAAISYFSDPGKFVPKTLIGALQGAGGGALATTIGKWFGPSEKSLPRAQTSALQSRLAGTTIDDASRAIGAESAAMGNVLPLPPARAQLPAQTFAPPPPMPAPMPGPRALPGPATPPPAAGYDPLAIQSQKLGKAGAAGIGGAGLLGMMSGGQADAAQMPDIQTIIQLVEAGKLPPEVLRELLPTMGR